MACYDKCGIFSKRVRWGLLLSETITTFGPSGVLQAVLWVAGVWFLPGKSTALLFLHQKQRKRCRGHSSASHGLHALRYANRIFKRIWEHFPPFTAEKTGGLPRFLHEAGMTHTADISRLTRCQHTQIRVIGYSATRSPLCHPLNPVLYLVQLL